LFFYCYKKAADFGHKEGTFKYTTLLGKEYISSTNSLEMISWMKKTVELGYKEVMFNYDLSRLK
jgi:hypothetical protein